MLERELFNQDKQSPQPKKEKRRKKAKSELEEEKEKPLFPNLPEEIIERLNEAELRGKGKFPSSD